MKGPWACKCLLVGLVVFSVHPTAAWAQKLMVGYSGVTAIQAPFWVIKDAGFFKQEGLDANLIYISSSSRGQAMLAGETIPQQQQAVVTTGFREAICGSISIVNFVALSSSQRRIQACRLRGKPVE